MLFATPAPRRLRALFPTAAAPLRLAALAGAAALLSACAQPTGPIGAVEPEAGAVPAEGPVRTALLLPQTTSDAFSQEEAREILQAARIAAAEEAGLVELQVYDTGGTEAGAAAAARRAAAEGAQVVIGPLRRDTTRAVRPVAEETGLSVFSFSSDSGVAGPPVWLLGDLPENEIERILGYAAAQGIDRLALVRPQDDYGQVIERAVYQNAPRYGITVTGSLPYERTFEGVQQAINRGAAGLRAGNPEAVLVAEGDQPLRAVAAFLADNDIIQPQTRYLGTAFWDGPETVKEPLLQGGWFAAPDPTAREGFAQVYQAQTGQTPGPRAALGYDAVKAVAGLAREARAAGDATPFDAASVAQAAPFRGAAGPFRLTPEGGNQRALAVYEVTSGGFRTLDPGLLPGAGS